MSDSRFKKNLVPPAEAPSGTKLPGSDTSALRKPKLSDAPRRRSIPEGLWTKCPQCGAMLYDKDLAGNLEICPTCQHHFPIKARARIASLTDPDSFEELDAGMASVDILQFTGVATYVDRLAKYQKSTGLKDAVVTGVGRLDGRPLALAVMEFSFLGGSMGSVVGEKITRCIETATKKRLGLVIVSSSGGARMYEGMFSLMQMAKTSAALAYHGRAGLPFISVLTNPTTAGVMASYASLGDLIIAEPAAMIGFAGPRVIKDTTQATLPPGFQTAEFLQEHGLIDAIVPRNHLRERLAFHLDLLGAATVPPTARAPGPEPSQPAPNRTEAG
ncbi:MAG: acetyl-CoA carboxylase carboxyltransferase subunit beta [Verrucomicrobiales bacterium]|nr:acetyl-CoA carboxylase carboxyltransferase subunit beta [Verrucomicrobiales bacterium]